VTLLGNDAGASYPGKRKHWNQEKPSPRLVTPNLPQVTGDWLELVIFDFEEDDAATGIRNLREVRRGESYLDAVKSGETGSIFGGVL